MLDLIQSRDKSILKLLEQWREKRLHVSEAHVEKGGDRVIELVSRSVRRAGGQGKECVAPRAEVEGGWTLLVFFVFFFFVFLILFAWFEM